MKGTEKQIEWANSIVTGWIRGIDKHVEEAKDRVSRGTMPPEWAEIMSTTAAEWKADISKLDSAKEIIDIRQADFAAKCIKAASAKYEAAKK